MAKLATKLIIAAALVTAGCAKKRPAELPPPPGPAQATTTTTTDTTSTADQITPGSAEDFKRSVQADTIHFATDKYDVDDPSRAILDSQAQWLSKYPQVRITIEGHCDERGTREYNLALGDRRANAAKNYLVGKGVDAGRISVLSYGKERPLALGSDDESYAQNRRAVTVVIGR
jgi:peptidoglycan-associated lipoprotein